VGEQIFAPGTTNADDYLSAGRLDEQRSFAEVRLLYVVPNVPSSIRARPFNFIRRLSRKHEVTVLCVASDSTDRQFAWELRQHCQRVEVVDLPIWRSLWNCCVALFSGEALRYAYFYSPKVQKYIQQKVQNSEVDLVHAEHLKSFRMVEPVTKRVATVFDAVDCVSMLEARRIEIMRNPVLRFFSWTEWKKTMRSETRASEHFGRIVITSAVDRQSYPLSKSFRGKIQVISNGVDLDHFGFQQFRPQVNTVVFWAKLDYHPNADAAIYLARVIWPYLRRRRPELQLHIVGSRPSQRIRQLDGVNNIRIFASVPDVRPLVGSACVALVPLRLQAGVQNKILEAMSMGVPVVATRICSGGISAEPGKHFLVADTPEEFADAVDLLLDNRSFRAGLVRAGREYVEKNHDWDRVVEQLDNTYEDVLAEFDESRRPI
jgi:sugar transferase (PEP-CTERM/EpsH1 system associated)